MAKTMTYRFRELKYTEISYVAKFILKGFTTGVNGIRKIDANLDDIRAILNTGVNHPLSEAIAIVDKYDTVIGVTVVCMVLNPVMKEQKLGVEKALNVDTRLSKYEQAKTWLLLFNKSKEIAKRNQCDKYVYSVFSGTTIPKYLEKRKGIKPVELIYEEDLGGKT